MSIFNRRAEPAAALMQGADKQAGTLTTRAPEPQAEAPDSRLLLMQTGIGAEDVRRAGELLKRYKAGKANLEARIIEDEEWYRLRHWNVIRAKGTGARSPDMPNPTSAWLFNAILNKHADLMDNVPEAGVLPREAGDEPEAHLLSSILPCILERNEFEHIYSQNGWDKLKHGTPAYFVGWNPRLENGLGDIDIHAVDILNLFWEPGITNIQDSANLFITALVSNDTLRAQYPKVRPGNTVEVSKYNYDDTVDTTDMSVVVDWYYKVRTASGKMALHYAKFVGDTLLYASQNDPRYQETGWYAHAMYPVVLDPLYPEKGTPAGFGLVSITKDPQMYIDRLGGCILENAMQATNPRYFMSENTGVNEEEFKDPATRVVHVAGNSLDETKIRPVETAPLNGNYISVLQLKIEEMKETSSNRDVTSGGSTSGVTAASAIAALQEAGNKTSRDMIAGTYRAFSQICYLCIELIRQFYDERRTFRIAGDDGYTFESYVNTRMREQEIPGYADTVRRPVFDIRVKAQKRNPFSRAIQNQMGKELYGMGFFAPQKAQEALGALELMEFEGKDKVREYVAKGQTLSGQVEKLTEMVQRMAAQMGMNAAGQETPERQGAASVRQPSAPQDKQAARASAVMAAQSPRTPYAQALAARSTPDMNRQSGVNPQ